MKNSTLVVVDVQDGFWHNAVKVERELKTRIRTAIDKGQNIIVLELLSPCHGPTHESILELLSIMDQDKLHIVEKITNCGGYEVMSTIEGVGWDINTGIQICGVNLCYCVYQTAEYLAKLTDVELLLDSTTCWDDCYCQEDIGTSLDLYENIGIAVNRDNVPERQELEQPILIGVKYV